MASSILKCEIIRIGDVADESIYYSNIYKSDVDKD